MTSAAPTVWPHCELPAPRGRIGHALLRGDRHRRRALPLRCAAQRRRSARPGRSRRRWSSGRGSLASNRTSPSTSLRSARRDDARARTDGNQGHSSRRSRIPQCPARAGRHFLQIPGPTNVPDRVLRAIDLPTMDHRGPEFAALGKSVLAGMKRVFKSTQGEVVIYPASGTGAWEAALVNTLSPGDRVLMAETGHFATLWQKMAAQLGLRGRVPARRLAPRRRSRGDRRSACAPTARKRIKAVCVVHNETSTGVVIAHRRRAQGDRRRQAIRRSTWSTRSPRSPRSTTGTTNGASTSPSPARRRA